MKNYFLLQSGKWPGSLRVWGLAFVFLLSGGTIRAQEAYNVSGPSIKVLGTSSLHDWSMEAKDITCSAKFNFTPGSNQPSSLTTLEVSILVHNLKSGESLMDSRAYNAMKADKFGTITFSSASAVVTPGQKNQFQIKSTGSLKIAGAAQTVTLTAACQVNSDGSITCSGTQKIKMTDYQIKPPVFMLGVLKTGDELTINFSMTFKK